MNTLFSTSQPAGEMFGLLTDSGGVLRGSLVDPAVTPAGPVSPFKGTYYVDPTFAGVQTGSQANPFTTVAAAFAAATAQALTQAIVYIAPGAVVVENVVFPATGTAWELAALDGWVAANPNGTVINGTITCDTSSAVINFRVSKLIVTGAITGNTSAGSAGSSLLTLDWCRVSGGVTLTTSGPGTWSLDCIGRGATDANGLGGVVIGALSVAGRIYGDSYRFGSSSAWSVTAQFNSCIFLLPAFSPTAASTITLQDCFFNAAATFTATGTLTVITDAFTLSRLMLANVTTVGTVTFNGNTANGAANRQTLAGNAGTFTAANKSPTGLYVLEGTFTILVPGTSGALQFNLLYTDVTGVARTIAVLTVPLPVTSAAGTEQPFSLIFSQSNAGPAIQYTVTGVIVAGALSYSLAAAVRAAGP